MFVATRNGDARNAAERERLNLEPIVGEVGTAQAGIEAVIQGLDFLRMSNLNGSNIYPSNVSVVGIYKEDLVRLRDRYQYVKELLEKSRRI